MRKLFVAFAVAVLTVSVCHSVEKEKQADSSKQIAQKGNGGKDKIGGWLGFPEVGISYSHEFNDIVQLDLLAGGSVLLVYNSLSFQAGTLFTVWEPVIQGQKCPLSLGPAIGIDAVDIALVGSGAAFTVLFPLRWEVNFGKAPHFNLFIDLSPVGYSLFVTQSEFDDKPSVHHNYMTRFGVGLRARIPSRR